MSGAGLFSPRAPLSDSIPNPGTGTDNVAAQSTFLRDKEVADYQQEPKITIAENDTSDFVKHTVSITSSSRFVAEGERNEERGERESVGSGKCMLWETGAPNRKDLRGVRVSQGPKSGPWETPGPN